MTLAPHTRLGPYEVTGAIGAGGMGEVYRGHDPTLNRDVAIKVLPAALAADAERLARFKREAQVLASLNHPNIAHVYGFEAATLPDGSTAHFLAMELVEGEDLSERLKRGAIPVDEAIGIARQIAEGLEEAHEHGIIHRDLKPANVKVTPNGKVKVLDFGLAKAMEGTSGDAIGAELSNSPTMSRHMTEAGMVMGTAAYMSPEQARGKTVDKRADIWSFGVVGFEMLTGTRLFSGETVSDTLASVLREEIPWSRLPAGTPPGLTHLLKGCLTRDAHDRLRDIGDARFLLASGADGAGTGSRAPAHDPTRSSRTALAAGLIAVVLLVAFALLRPATQSTQETFRLGQRIQVTRETTLEVDPALSPDGKLVAYAAGTLGQDFKVFVRQVDGGSPIAVAPALESSQRFPAWSPDGTRLLFRSRRGIEVGPALGGVTRVLTPLPGSRAVWSPDGTAIAFSGRGIWIMPADGGEPRNVVSSRAAHSPAWSPDGQWIAYVEGNGPGVFAVGNLAPSQLWIVPAAGGEARRLTDTDGVNLSPAWLRSEMSLLFVSNREGGRDVYSLPLSSDGVPTGKARALTTGINAWTVSVSAGTDRVAYSVVLDRSNVWSMPVPVGGPASSMEAMPVTSGNQIVETFDVSPDGQWLAFDALRTGNQDIFRMPVTGGPVEQLTSDPADDFAPAISPDAREIAFYSYRDQSRIRLFRMPVRGEPAARIGEVSIAQPRWSPDGNAIVGRRRSDAALVVVRRVNEVWSGEEILASQLGGSFADWSPDGRSIAYTGSAGLMVVDSLTKATRTLVDRRASVDDELDTSAGGQYYPQWASDGRAVYFIQLDESGIYRVPALGGPARLAMRFDSVHPWHHYGFRVRGGRFYFTLGELESDLFVADLGG